MIRAERAREIQTAVDNWRDQGGHTVMVTGTVRHRQGDPLEVGLDAVIRGWQRLLNRRSWRKIKADLGIVGAIRSVEITWTVANGWHPHTHVLLFCEQELTAEQVTDLEDRIFAEWRKIVVSLGAREPQRKHGVKVTRGAAEYIAKVQEHDRAGVEMTRFDLKKSRSAQGFMPFEFLDVEGEDRPRAQRLWWEYVTATRARRAITWTRGLRDRLLLDEEQTDEELIEATESADLQLVIPGPEYDRSMKERPGRATAVLELVEQGELSIAARIAGGSLAPPARTGLAPQAAEPRGARPGRTGAPPDATDRSSR